MTTPEARHSVYPGGPPCNPNCPGESSMYHDGYADGYENAEGAGVLTGRADTTTPEAPRTEAGKWLPTCDIVPGSLGGYRSVPWCRTHQRYASACSAILSAPPPATPGLDVDWLARAMAEVWPVWDGVSIFGGAQ